MWKAICKCFCFRKKKINHQSTKESVTEKPIEEPHEITICLETPETTDIDICQETAQESVANICQPEDAENEQVNDQIICENFEAFNEDQSEENLPQEEKHVVQEQRADDSHCQEIAEESGTNTCQPEISNIHEEQVNAHNSQDVKVQVPGIMDISEPLVSICVKPNAYEPPALSIQSTEEPSNSPVEPRCPIALEHFDLGQVLGEGGFGTVVLAKHKNTKELCAIKALKKEEILKKGNMDSVFNEKKILQRISEAEHPFLVSLHGTFQTDSHLFFAMEYLPGGDMFDFATCVELQEPDIMFYTACIVLGLEALHNMGIFHRDLKLENLMLDQGGYLKIIDFGLSKDRFGYTDRTNAICGTRTYMAPEMFMDIGYGMAADWWALGISIYAMLMYELPFNNEDQNELMNSILYDEIELPEELSEDVCKLIYELLEKDPDYRLGSGEAGAEVIKAQPFFRDIDWEQLLHRKTKPPYVFNNQGHLESFNRPECQAPALTTSAVKIPSELQEAFREFDYTPD